MFLEGIDGGWLVVDRHSVWCFLVTHTRPLRTLPTRAAGWRSERRSRVAVVVRGGPGGNGGGMLRDLRPRLDAEPHQVDHM